MGTKAVIVLPNWQVYKSITKELKLLRQIPIEEDIFMRPSITGSYGPTEFIKSIFVINYWVIDNDIPILTPTPTIVLVAPTLPIINYIPIDNYIESMVSKAPIESVNTYLSATTPLVVTSPLENHSLVRFTIAVSQENITSKTDTLIDTATSLTFMSKNFLNANGF
jgi:hypothetical protein